MCSRRCDGRDKEFSATAEALSAPNEKKKRKKFHLQYEEVVSS